MIRLIRDTEPSELKLKKAELLKKYKLTKEPVWREVESLSESLLGFSNNKCAYCERKLNRGTLTVEHFHPRKSAPKEVLEWNNLLPCCKECNTNKDNFNTMVEDFIDPCTDDPSLYLHLNTQNLFFDINDGNKKAFNTVNILKFNERRSSLYRRRFNIKNKVDTLFSNLLNIYLSDNAVSCLKDLFLNSDDKAELSAVYSTCILKSSYYKELKHRIIEDGKWDNELEQKEAVARGKCL